MRSFIRSIDRGALVIRRLRVASAIALTAAQLTWAPPLAAQPLFGPTQDPLAGSRLFGAKGCVRCHAIDGAGGRIGPDLGRIARPRSYFDLAASMWNHAPRMADRMRQLGIARPTLEGRESGDLIAFLFTVDYFERGGDVEAGRRLFSQKRCIVCHQAGGVGGVVGPNLETIGSRTTPISLAAAMWNHGPQMAEMMRARAVVRPTFKPGELRDLVAYIGATPARDEPLYVVPGEPDEGRRLFVERRCADCHGSGGRGGAAPDLTDRRLHGSTVDFAAAMWNKAPGMTAAMKARGIPFVQLQPAEMADILAYLYAVRYVGPAGDPRRGVVVAADKGCLGCHALAGERGKPASDLTRSRLVDSPVTILGALWNHAFLEARPGTRPRWASMTGAELGDLMAYLQSLGRSR
jgi:mono/diheme cytochrome c family protein